MGISQQHPATGYFVCPKIVQNWSMGYVKFWNSLATYIIWNSGLCKSAILGNPHSNIYTVVEAIFFFGLRKISTNIYPTSAVPRHPSCQWKGICLHRFGSESCGQDAPFGSIEQLNSWKFHGEHIIASRHPGNAEIGWNRRLWLFWGSL